MKLNKDIAHTEIGDSVILLQSGDEKTYHELNPTASVIWKMALQGSRVQDIAEKLSEDFEIELDQAREDVEEFLEELSQQGITEL